LPCEKKTHVFDPLASRLTDASAVARDQDLDKRGQRAALDQIEQDIREAELLSAARRDLNEFRPTSPSKREPAKLPQEFTDPAENQSSNASSETSHVPTSPPPRESESFSSPLGAARYIPDQELEEAIAAADALKPTRPSFLKNAEKPRSKESWRRPRPLLQFSHPPRKKYAEPPTPSPPFDPG
jgi:hypothetical protein